MSFFRSILWLCPAAMVIAVWAHAHQTYDSILAFGPRGWVQVASATGDSTVLAFTTMSGGEQRAWSALVVDNAVPEMSPVGDAQFTLAYHIGVVLFTGTDMPMWRGFGINAGLSPRVSSSPPGAPVVFVVPFWVWLAAALLPPLWMVKRAYTRHVRRRRGRCVECGYDLRATPGRCPECGTEVGTAVDLPAAEGGVAK
jgi:hypothetical protein